MHPRNPYARVDAVRSDRPVRVELDGMLLAEADSSVIVFETGLPPRYYLDQDGAPAGPPRAVGHRDLVPVQGGHQPVLVGAAGRAVHPDLAWCYAFPTAPLLAVAGLVAFYNEKVDLFVAAPAGPAAYAVQLTDPVTDSTCGAYPGKAATIDAMSTPVDP